MRWKQRLFWLLAIVAGGMVFAGIIAAYRVRSMLADPIMFAESRTPAPMESAMLLPGAFEPVTFPMSISFGTASSAFQINPYAPGSNWDAWERAHPSIPDGLAIRDAYHEDHLYERDAAAAHAIGITDHRISVNWALLVSKPGTWNETEAEHVRREIRSFQRYGINIWICLYHFVEPERFSWLDPDAPEQFGSFARMTAERIGKPLGVRIFLTMNEPMVPALEGYLKGGYPPGLKTNWEMTERVVRSMARAHRIAYRMIKDVYGKNGDEVRVGVATAANAFVPASDSLTDATLTDMVQHVLNEDFLNMTEEYQDFIATTYYRRYTLKASVWSAVLGDWVKDEYSADGLYVVLKRMAKYGKPLYIAENGVNTSDESFRVRFIAAHLLAMHRALQEGIDVRGYAIWSLTDTYEWSRGYNTHFGLFGIERPAHKLIWRQGVFFYRDVIATRSLTPELVKKYLMDTEQ